MGSRSPAGCTLSAVEVKLGKPTLEAVGWSGAGQALVEIAPGGWEQSLDAYSEEWIDITVAVELQPRPDRDWLVFWEEEEELGWPDHLSPPLLDGETLIFGAREQELEEAWAAVKACVDATNRAYREARALVPDGYEPDAAAQESLARLREAAQRRIDALE
jgi:hypothetical protein